MAKNPQDRPKKGFLRDSVQIWDEKFLDWQEAWEHRFNKRTFHEFFKLFDAYETGPYRSEAFYCAPYRNALVFIDLRDTVGAPTSILISAWFSWDGVNWFWYKRDFWGHMDWEDIALPVWEAVDIPILAPYMQIRVGVTGGEAVNKVFPVRITAVFNST